MRTYFLPYLYYTLVNKIQPLSVDNALQSVIQYVHSNHDG